MPELPEVETVCRGLAAHLVGRRILEVVVRRHDLRMPIPQDFAARLSGRTVERIGRRAKYMLWHLHDGTVVIGHLGMSGSVRVQPAAEPGAPVATHDHVLLRLDDGARVVWSDPRRFGLLLLSTAATLAQHPLVKDLGPEPLEATFTPKQLLTAMARKQVPLKAALLDQKLVAGLGNIYVSEALFRAGLSPERIASTLDRPRAARLHAAIQAVLSEAIESGGSTLRDYVRVGGEAGGFQHRFHVYDRADQPCPRPGCRGTIRRTVQAGRSTYACSRCQR
jgi:formamidopyrimidine-DNA glycosylase